MFEVKVLSGEALAQDKANTGKSIAVNRNEVIPFDADVVNQGNNPLVLAIFKDGLPAGEIKVAPSGRVRFEDMVNTTDNSVAIRVVPYCDNLVEVSGAGKEVFVGAEEACTGAERGLFGLFVNAGGTIIGASPAASAGVIAAGFFIVDNSIEDQESPEGTTLPGSFTGSGSESAGVRGTAEALSAGLENSTLAPLAPVGEILILAADGLVEVVAGLTGNLPGLTGADLNAIALAEPNNVGASGVVGATSTLADGIERAFEETILDSVLTPVFDLIGSSPNNEVSILSLLETTGEFLAQDQGPLELITAQTLAPVIGSRGVPPGGPSNDGAPFFEPGPLF